MTWRVLREDVDLFRRELWKDERSFRGDAPVAQGEFLKDCFDARRASIELRAITQLRSSHGELLCPPARRAGDAQIALGRVRGIRLFDLIRLLRELELIDRDGRASFAIQRIIARQRHRLHRIQIALIEIAPELASCSYPMESKLSDLLHLLSRVFGSDDLFTAARCAISRFANYWQTDCCLVPFRDATTKNCIVGDPRLDPSEFEDDSDRLRALHSILSDEDRYADEIALWDIDFSSVEHLTAPEDDPISLHCHEWTDGSCELSPYALLLLDHPFKPDPYRSAAALLIRYLRFGGRKLAYKVINAQGFEVRFRYDNPLFYFENVLSKCGALSGEFVKDYADLFKLIEDIRYRAANPSLADEALLRVDHFRRFVPERTDFWQENPKERGQRRPQDG